MGDLLVMGLLLIGALFTLVASLGLLRMPDLYMRMSASAKANTLGISLMLGAAEIYFPGASTKGIILATIAFIFLTNPVGAQMIARAAYLSGVPMWRGTLVDEASEYYRGIGRATPDRPPEGR